MDCQSKHILAVIPARYASERFPGKPLANIAGKPMIQWVYERTSAADVAETIVATDDDRIFNCVNAFGGKAVMTSPNHTTGSDRIAEAISHMEADIVINVQGDEPLISVSVINELIGIMKKQEHVEMGTIAVPFGLNDREYQNPNSVKVVVDDNNFALYFSRAAIPYFRATNINVIQPLKHWGIYAYKTDFLRQFVKWPQGNLERTEMLEQLRALEHGVKILVLITENDTIGVDVPEDIEKVEQKLIQPEV